MSVVTSNLKVLPSPERTVNTPWVDNRFIAGNRSHKQTNYEKTVTPGNLPSDLLPHERVTPAVHFSNRPIVTMADKYAQAYLQAKETKEKVDAYQESLKTNNLQQVTSFTMPQEVMTNIIQRPQVAPYETMNVNPMTYSHTPIVIPPIRTHPSAVGNHVVASTNRSKHTAFTAVRGEPATPRDVIQGVTNVPSVSGKMLNQLLSVEAISSADRDEPMSERAGIFVPSVTGKLNTMNITPKLATSRPPIVQVPINGRVVVPHVSYSDIVGSQKQFNTGVANRVERVQPISARRHVQRRNWEDFIPVGPGTQLDMGLFQNRSGGSRAPAVPVPRFETRVEHLPRYENPLPMEVDLPPPYFHPGANGNPRAPRPQAAPRINRRTAAAIPHDSQLLRENRMPGGLTVSAPQFNPPGLRGGQESYVPRRGFSRDADPGWFAQGIDDAPKRPTKRTRNGGDPPAKRRKK